ncbi:TonB-dependent receptor [Nibrella saemangeumensis]|uniref:TonB-dependent receptor n=1 Tax=Nibrella saemangeumensis TaxID=1084526 RepID=A0ABP8MNY0_9BACT
MTKTTLKCYFLTLLLVVCTAAGWAQSITLSGTITDAATNQPLPGVNITIKGRAVGTATNRDGRFSLQTNQALPLTLVATYVGYGRQEVTVSNSGNPINFTLREESLLADEVVVSASRVEESLTKASVTVEKLGPRQFQQSPAATPYDALQNLKGVDLLTQSLTFKSVNIRGFGANNNNRFVQWTDGMDNRSPGLGFGFGNVAGISDLDIESIEIIPGASSALYGPDALQGLMLTRSKNPFEYQGLSAQVKVGVNNVGKEGFGPKPYTDLAIRYAKQLGERFAFKVNFQRLDGTDFIADDYSDRSHRDRAGFFTTDASRGNVATGINFQPNSNPNTNLQYDGVNIYGDDFNTAGAFRYPANHPNAALAGQLVTRTGYTELDILGNNGKVFNTRANASLYYKLTEKIQATVGWYYGNGNFIRTAGFREYFPDYNRHQIKAEISSDNFFVRAYTTQQTGEGWNIGQTAQAINNAWKPIAQWSADFAAGYSESGGVFNQVDAARNRADQGRYLPGSSDFNRVKDLVTGTWNNVAIPSLGRNGTRFRDNSSMWHYEGMYNFKNLTNVVELIAGASYRHYGLESGGTLFPRKNLGNGQFEEYTIDEYGAYVQASKEVKLASLITLKPTVAVRYDKNEYFKGGFTPRASAVLSVGPHNFRGSWQSAFRNPSPNQLLSMPPAGQGGEVGGSPMAYEATGLNTNPAYLVADAQAFVANTITQQQLQERVFRPGEFTTEKIKTWEVGYKTLLNNRLFIDAFLYRSVYTDFIAAQNAWQPNSGQVADFRTNAFRALQVNFNNFNEIFVNGWGVGADYVLGRGYSLSGNYARQVGLITLRDARGNVIKDRAGNDVVKRRMSNPEVAQLGRNFFISPENRYNITLSNPRVTPMLGFAVTYRWTDKMWVEQGTTAGDIWLPAWNTLDAQVSYRLPAIKSILKVGGSNILNQYYAQGYGLARIGGLYYVSLTFDELMR